MKWNLFAAILVLCLMPTTNCTVGKKRSGPDAPAGNLTEGSVLNGNRPLAGAEVSPEKEVQTKTSSNEDILKSPNAGIPGIGKTNPEGGKRAESDKPAEEAPVSTKSEGLGSSPHTENPTPAPPVEIKLNAILTLKGRVKTSKPELLSETVLILDGTAVEFYPTSETLPLKVESDGSFMLHVDNSEPQWRYKCALVAKGPEGYGGIGPILPSLFGDWTVNENWKVQGKTFDSLDFELKKLANGSLTIQDQNQKPLANQEMKIYPPLGLGGRKWDYGPFGTNGKTDDSGRIILKNVWPGEHEVVLTGDEYWGTERIDLSSPDGWNPVVTVHTVTNVKYQGLVRDNQGQLIPQVKITIQIMNATEMMTSHLSATTDDQGRFMITHLPKLPWGFEFAKEGYKTFSLDVEEYRENMEITMEKMAGADPAKK